MRSLNDSRSAHGVHLVQAEGAGPDTGKGFPEFLAQCRHPGEGTGDFKRVDDRGKHRRFLEVEKPVDMR